MTIKLPKALREQIWLHYIGKKYSSKCLIKWCNNEINVFDFHIGHNVPASKGGTICMDNLLPICARCNLSMSNNYTIDQWTDLMKKRQSTCCCIFVKFLKNLFKYK